MPREDKVAVHTAFEEIEAFDPTTPEKNLLRAILLGALHDLKKTVEEQKRATEFLLSPEDDYVFSFLSICDYLKIDPHKVLLIAGLEEQNGNRHQRKDLN